MSHSNTSWFEKVFGFPESVPNVYKYIKTEETSEGVVLISTAFTPPKKMNSGIFEQKSISNFDLVTRGYGKFFILSGGASKYPSKVQVTQAQSLPENNGATFQAASNFNCLEFCSMHQTASEGITGYIYDRTQGPYCAIAASASILYRNYFVKIGNGEVGQIRTNLNLLSDTPFDIYHGYPNVRSEGAREKSEIYKNFDWNNLDNYRMGVHSNCQVLLTQDMLGNLVLASGDQIVHHVYCAALDFSGSVPHNLLYDTIGKAILRASYKISILSAWENSVKYPDLAGSKKLYLTLLGGGVFGNPHEWICDAVLENEQLIVESGLEVYLIFYNGFSGKNTSEGKLLAMSKRTGGNIVLG